MADKSYFPENYWPNTYLYWPGTYLYWPVISPTEVSSTLKIPIYVQAGDIVIRTTVKSIVIRTTVKSIVIYSIHKNFLTES